MTYCSLLPLKKGRFFCASTVESSWGWIPSDIIPQPLDIRTLAQKKEEEGLKNVIPPLPPSLILFRCPTAKENFIIKKKLQYPTTTLALPDGK